MSIKTTMMTFIDPAAAYIMVPPLLSALEELGDVPLTITHFTPATEALPVKATPSAGVNNLLSH